VLGIISLVLGILGTLISLVPCVGMIVGGPVAGIGLLLGAVGLIVALMTKRTGVGLPVAGSAVSFVGLCIAGAWLAVSTLWVREVGKEVQAQAAREEQERQAIREGPAVEVTAAALQKEYNDNAIAADRKYKGQVLVVKGRVERVTQDDFEATVELKTDEEGETVDCEFAGGQKTDLAGLKPGQQVTIRGRCQGQDGGSPTLEKCILVSKGTP
jgi:hypothetical protein